jgi:hypothetical protein
MSSLDSCPYLVCVRKRRLVRGMSPSRSGLSGGMVTLKYWTFSCSVEVRQWLNHKRSR